MSTTGWKSGDTIRLNERGRDIIPDAIESQDPERGPVPAGVLLEIGWAEGRMGTETLWFQDWAAANRYGRENDPGWTDGKGDFAEPGQRYGSPATAWSYQPELEPRPDDKSILAVTGPPRPNRKWITPAAIYYRAKWALHFWYYGYFRHHWTPINAARQGRNLTPYEIKVDRLKARMASIGRAFDRVDWLKVRLLMAVKP